MTMPTEPGSPAYEPTFPRIVLMSTDGVDSNGTPINWGVGDPHPFKPKLRVAAMYINGSIVEIYSSDGATVGMREIVPLHRARLVREEMPLEVWVEELRHAELGYPGDDDEIEDDSEEEEPEETAAPEPPNGQSAP